LLPIPDRLVVLTFDDGTKTDITTVAPILKRYGFDASFYVTEGLREIKGSDDALTWEGIRKLNDEGFEIGRARARNFPTLGMGPEAPYMILPDTIHF